MAALRQLVRQLRPISGLCHARPAPPLRPMQLPPAVGSRTFFTGSGSRASEANATASQRKLGAERMGFHEALWILAIHGDKRGKFLFRRMTELYMIVIPCCLGAVTYRAGKQDTLNSMATSNHNTDRHRRQVPSV